MFGTDWRKIVSITTAVLLVVLFSLSPIPRMTREGGSWFTNSEALAARAKRLEKSTPEKTSARVGKLTEVAPPKTIQELQRSLDNNQPQIFILSPRPNEVLSDDTVSVQFQVRDLPIFKDEATGLGPHLHVLLDNQTYQAVYDISKPLVFTNLAPGTHTIRAFASRPWHESFKNEGAYDQATFHVFTKTQENNPSQDLPLLTYSRPQGVYGAEPIMLDFYLNNAPLHLVARDDKEVADWQIRCTVNGNSFVINDWQPIYLKGFKPGKNWVQLEFLDEAGKPVNNVYNSTARVIQYEPGGSDTLSKLVRGELATADARSLIDPNYKPPIPTPEPVPPAEPVKEAEPMKDAESIKDAIAKPSPTPTPIPVVPEIKIDPSPTPSVSPAPITKPAPLPGAEPISTPKPMTSPDLKPVLKPDLKPDLKRDFGMEPPIREKIKPELETPKPTAKDAIDNFLNQFRPTRKSTNQPLIPEPIIPEPRIPEPLVPKPDSLLEPLLETIPESKRAVEPVLTAPTAIEPVKITTPRAIAPTNSPGQTPEKSPVKHEPNKAAMPKPEMMEPLDAIAPLPLQPPASESDSKQPEAPSLNLQPATPKPVTDQASQAEAPGAGSAAKSNPIFEETKSTLTQKATDLKSEFSAQLKKIQERFRRSSTDEASSAPSGVTDGKIPVPASSPPSSSVPGSAINEPAPDSSLTIPQTLEAPVLSK